MTGVYDTRLTGIVKLSKSQYDAMETHDAGTKYIVVDGNSIKEYLGTIPIGASEGSGTDIRGAVSVVLGGNVCETHEETVDGYAIEYDETKVTIMLLDSNNGEPTGDKGLFPTISDALSSSIWSYPYGLAMHIGSQIGITTIPAWSFKDKANLVSADIPEGVTEIEGNYAFGYCTGLKRVKLPSTLETIGTSVFKSCTSLENIELTNGLKEIENNAFEGCTALTSIDIPDSVEQLGSYAFAETGLTSVSIPAAVQYLFESAFKDCTELETVFVGSGVQSISSTAFSGCTGLTQITVNNAQDSISGAPWGATNATVTWIG